MVRRYVGWGVIDCFDHLATGIWRQTRRIREHGGNVFAVSRETVQSGSNWLVVDLGKVSITLAHENHRACLLEL